MIVSGYVFDNEMGVLPNVNVFVVGENRSTITDENGYFSILVDGLLSELRFDLLGYDYDTIEVDDFKKTGYIELYPATNQLEEVGVVNNTKSSSNLGLIFGVLAVGSLLFLATKKTTKSVKVKA